MLKSQRDKRLLANTRISVVNSRYNASIGSAIILSNIFTIFVEGFLGWAFSWAWLGLAIWAFYKRRRELKDVEEFFYQDI